MKSKRNLGITISRDLVEQVTGPAMTQFLRGIRKIQQNEEVTISLPVEKTFVLNVVVTHEDDDEDEKVVYSVL